MSRVTKIIKLFTRDATPYAPPIGRDFAEWMVSPHDDHQKQMALREVWDDTDAVADASTQKLYKQFLIHTSSDTHRQQVRITLRRVASVAAILCVALLTSLFTYMYANKSATEKQMKMVECFAQAGQIRTITLPDSSKVNLNSSSLIVYPKTFEGSQREVYISGEASFSVTKNGKKPFIVNTAHMKVEVLGTVFNVNAYTDNQTSTIVLKQGLVKVVLEGNDRKAILLKPNQQIEYDHVSGLSRVSDVNAEELMAWQDGSFIIQHKSIHTIVRMMERRFNINVYLTTSKYNSAIITAKFVNDESLEDFLVVFKELIPGLKYRIEDSNLYLY